jgi:enoyl-CoA hydratase
MEEIRGMPTYDHILYRVEDKIARITLNRPEKRNALSRGLRDDILAGLKEAERDDAVSVVLIDGAGLSFCAGYDITPNRPVEPTSAAVSPDFDWTDQFARSCIRDWLTIWDLLKPVVAMVHGACLAGGTELMSMCDIVFAADDARIGYPPSRGQTTPDVMFFPWKLPMNRAKYLQLTGNSLTGTQAADWGWVTKSFPAEHLEEETLREVRPITAIAPDLLAGNKLAINQTYEIMGFRTALNTAPLWHMLSGRVRPHAGEFARISREEGLRAALQWRDGPFLKEGIL